MSNNKICIITLGCKVNQYESHTFENYFKDKGFLLVSIDEKADVIIVNTCAVTMQATRKSRQLIRKARRLNENAFIIIIGCLAQLETTKEQLKDEVNVFIGSEDKSKVVDIVMRWSKNNNAKFNQNSVTNISEATEFDEMPSYAEGSRVRAEVKVQDGCEQFCSYCLIPYMRGPERSRPVNNVIKEINYLVEHGYKEVVLTGIHLGSYGKKLPTKTDLTQLVKSILEKTTIKRLRLSSVEPNDVTDELINIIANNKRVASHLHLPLQGGSDKLLKDMNRRYTTGEYLGLVKKIRDKVPNIALTTDLIVGFPSETEQDFEDTMRFIKKVKFSAMHIFRFSTRPGTKAAKMKNKVHGDIVKSRSDLLHKVAIELKQKYEKAMLNKVYEVLVEKCNEHYCEGHAENYVNVHIDNTNIEKNSLIKVQIIQTSTYCVKGIML
ncbi:tRNA (N(6)-L-threonylcarbamoyladenosine(37)-C(2))-methylthiotransferase MtaB [Clostridium sp. 'deep sea']|uniref:tRNA (N(6)-L-threonylcarbamoyladenosine(37)-C(2))- methylthiotransferase MtaB n=1 Tax=Clostridium sp. 'deep sea' TaxID=2779445 RepID=UPI0018966D7F|nr:tRNA (N(6)-L-threonylcarbamoyladenosine(37)-C(2))-methylthiotransferase MtaB [Clostridium sp. 'deep sea']QOR35588.1 tRNA (N(6)-L-threonylcarbamoyladenosine(37)-C(2))-methylthiotransferase MtaB [Clostridium sp. 'deep sea']